MKRTAFRSGITILLATGALSLGTAKVRGAFPVTTRPEAATVAFLSLANHTEEPGAPDSIRPLVLKGIEARGVRCVPDSLLRAILRKHRIRAVGVGVGPEHARMIGEDTGAEDLILGSVDVWHSGDDPEVGLSLRIVRIRDMRIVGATSVSATGSEFTRPFGFGSVTRIADLAPRVVRKALEGLDRSPAVDPPDSTGSRPRVALVTFDNLSGESHGGEIVTAILLSRMVQAGYDVIEPGIVNEIFLRNGENPRGEIDHALLLALAEGAGPRLVVTGAVQDLAPAGGPEGVPRFEFGARGIDGPSGRIVFALDRAADGADSETILRFGRIRSLTRLVERSIEPVIEAVGGVRERETEAQRR